MCSGGCHVRPDDRFGFGTIHGLCFRRQSVGGKLTLQVLNSVTEGLIPNVSKFGSSGDPVFLHPTRVNSNVACPANLKIW